ncbi:MAG: DEAD/DEAH box helicase [Alphaproteobacteria bacterium]|nr:DEAD/DEAH box helicase [Rickettsiales bacterium]
MFKGVPNYISIPVSFEQRFLFINDNISFNKKVIVCCKNTATIQWVCKLLESKSVPYNIANSADQVFASKAKVVWVCVFHVQNSFEIKQCIFLPSKLITIQNYGKFKHNKKDKGHKQDLMIALNDLKLGEPIIHIEHGVGIFEKSVIKTIHGQTCELLKIKYSNGNIYVPVEKIYALCAHNSKNPDNVLLDKIGGQSWVKLRESAKKQIDSIAHKLIDIAGKRTLEKATRYKVAERAYLLEQLENSFTYVETSDQSKAISDIFTDLESGKPMYRIICGDVGFGKTEVAMRAIFLVVCGKIAKLGYSQVTFLCPTVMLAEQQFESIKNRLECFGITVGFLCSNTKTAQVKDIINQVANGKIDILVGTSSILSNKIIYKNLGMIVCDEEHLFGVEQKELLLESYSNLHYLSLSATPIPRTLYKAVSGIQDISVISTPPHNRIGTKTNIILFDSSIIKSLINHECEEEGQVLFVTPKIAYIADLYHQIDKITPNKRIVIIHGGMSSKEIYDTNLLIKKNECDIIVATTIIASGMDFSYSNTVVIHKPNLFGLSQLHQIRGRVGRRSKQGNCYLLIEKIDLQNKAKMSRLYHMRSFSEFGAGFQIAQLDLETRGGGNLITKQQSGKVEHISVGLYYDLLNRAIEDIRQQKGNSLCNETKNIPEVNIDRSIYIPEEYISSLQVRIQMYRKIANIATLDELEGFYNEMINRFGKINIKIQNIEEIITLRDFCYKYNIKKLQLGGYTISIWFANNNLINVSALLDLASKQNSCVKISPNSIINVKMEKGFFNKNNNSTANTVDAIKATLINIMKSTLKK